VKPATMQKVPHVTLMTSGHNTRAGTDSLTDAAANNRLNSMTFAACRLVASTAVAALLLSGCTTTGGKTGGLLSSSHTSASAPYIAALGGGIISRAGVAVNAGDKERALEAEYRALEAAPGGQPVAWSGRGVSGQVVAAAPYQVGSQNCRQYTHTITINAKQAVARGAACRNTDGTWSPLT